MEHSLIFVLTGGPCAGKSTALEEIRRRGHFVIPEAAKGVILEGKLHPSRNPLEFQREVLRRQVRSELEAPPGSVFVDRGIGDHFGYLEHYRASQGIDMGKEFCEELAEAWEDALKRYRAVFILERGPGFRREVYRGETEEEAAAIHEALRSEYGKRHPSTISVPWSPLPERVDRILAIAARITSGRPPLPGG